MKSFTPGLNDWLFVFPMDLVITVHNVSDEKELIGIVLLPILITAETSF